MTKREAKIKALKIIGNSYLNLTECDIYSTISDNERKDLNKVNLEIENICFELLDRAARLNSKHKKQINTL